MARTLPKIGTNLKPYDSYRRYAATVTGYTKVSGTKMVKLRHATGKHSVASLAHITRTFKRWA